MYVFPEKHVRVFRKRRTCFRENTYMFFPRSDSPIYSITCQHIMFKISYCCFFVALLFYGLNLLDTFLDIRMAHEKVPQQIRTVILDHNRYRRLIQSHK